MTPAKPSQALIVQIERVLYKKPDSPFCLLKTNPCATGEGAQAVRGLVCKGNLDFEVQEGDRLQLEGYFETYNGEQQFRFRSAMPSLPVDLAALLHYAVSITKGLGETREAQIWSKYGDLWVTAETLEIDGIPERTQFAWADTLRKLREQGAQTQAITFLMSKGSTLTMANAAWAAWKENTIGIVNGDFYQLAQLPHYGFKTVDERIRPFFQIEDDDPRRLAACILYVIGDLGSSGDTMIERETLEANVNVLVPSTADTMLAALLALRDKGEVILPDNDTVAMASDWKNEEAVYERFAR
jgi:hypothetical protein